LPQQEPQNHDHHERLIPAWPLTDLERGADMGVPQVLHPHRAQETLLNILQSRLYLQFYEFDTTIREDTCRNLYATCTLDAMNGECTANPAWMLPHCPAACRNCETLHKNKRCAADPDAPDAWLPGDLDRMFQRLIHNNEQSQYNVTVLSSPELNNGGPYVIQMDNVVSAEEAKGVIAAAHKDGYGDRFYRANFRTAKIATCQNDCYEDAIVRRVSDRINALTGLNELHCEYLHLPQYDSKQFFALHSDYTPDDALFLQGVRLLTFYVYLNNVEAGGGGTFFNELNITVLPKRGRALVWPSVLNDHPHQQDTRLNHQGLPPNPGGIKYGMAAWYHMNDYKKAEALGCAIL
jgi:prolyl 4-hydroxylase